MRHRVAVRRQTAAALQAESNLAAVQVVTGWAGDLAERERISLGATTGTMTVPVFCGQPSDASPVTYDDDFTIKLYVEAAAAGQSYDEADMRLAEMWTHVERVLRSMGFDDDPDDYWVLTDATVGAVNTAVGSGREGFIGVLEADLLFAIRVSGRAR